MTTAAAALLVVSFGAPEAPGDVAGFLANVTRGRAIPAHRLAEVAERYYAVGGVSPLAAANRELCTRLAAELAPLPVYLGNRNWHPYLADTLARMADDGVSHAYGFVTSAFASYSGCRQYREDIEAARAAVGPRAPAVAKLRLFYNHPLFCDIAADRLRDSLAELGTGERPDPVRTRLLFTAHSVPAAMAAGSAYVDQLREVADLVATAAAPGLGYELVWQSRSGPPQVPWLEPDLADALRRAAADGITAVVVVPLGFVADHMEVVYDLDVEAAGLAHELGLRLARAATPGSDPRFTVMIRELLAERREGAPRRWRGRRGPAHDCCPADCCLAGGAPRPVAD